MDWTELLLTVQRPWAQTAQDAAAAVADGGLYIEDYADLQEQVQAITHMDLIDEELAARPKDRVVIHLYVSPDDAPQRTVERLRQLLDEAGAAYTMGTASVRQQDWENAWKQYYKPVAVGRRLMIVPSWHSYEGPRTPLWMDPGMAFGTGTHETTALCLAMLDEQLTGGERLLDVGTGSGILAIAALLLGAKEATGIDIDAYSVRTAEENAKRNRVQQRFAVHQGDLAGSVSGRYNIITANIVADAIIRLAPAVPGLLAVGGQFIASGIIAEKLPAVQAALAAAGLAITQQRTDKEWVALRCTAVF